MKKSSKNRFGASVVAEKEIDYWDFEDKYPEYYRDILSLVRVSSEVDGINISIEISVGPDGQLWLRFYRKYRIYQKLSTEQAQSIIHSWEDEYEKFSLFWFYKADCKKSGLKLSKKCKQTD